MPKHPKTPPKLSLVHRTVGLVKRNPWKAWPIIVSTVIGIPGLWASASFLDDKFEPWYYTSHALAREMLKDDHTYIIYLKLRDARQALKDAKEELVKNPNSGTVQRAVDYYVDVIAKYQKQLDKAAGN